MIGNTRLHALLKNGRKLSDLTSWFEVMDNRQMKELILNYVKNDQLFDKGIDSTGEVIGYYSYATEVISRGRKQQGDHYTLLDTGDLQRSLYVAIFIKEFVILGDVRKIQDQKWFSDKILGLTDENIGKIREVAKVKYIEYFKRVLFRIA